MDAMFAAAVELNEEMIGELKRPTARLPELLGFTDFYEQKRFNSGPFLPSRVPCKKGILNITHEI
jgi:hypothetical protein